MENFTDIELKNLMLCLLPQYIMGQEHPIVESGKKCFLLVKDILKKRLSKDEFQAHMQLLMTASQQIGNFSFEQATELIKPMMTDFLDKSNLQPREA